MFDVSSNFKTPPRLIIIDPSLSTHQSDYGSEYHEYSNIASDKDMLIKVGDYQLHNTVHLAVFTLLSLINYDWITAAVNMGDMLLLQTRDTS